jgi:NDP-4-keto-2,6-dideoxyhexose 3-C-methyltransferase
MSSYTAIHQCRICGNSNLEQVLDLGFQTLTGVFPKNKDQQVTSGPIRLVKCSDEPNSCGLLQMAHSYSLDEMYGDNYGYRSGLNASMVQHLHAKIQRILKFVDFSGSPLVLDIGSNDGTSLAAYPANQCIRVGMDPTAEKFKEYYQPNIHVISDFFSAKKFRQHFPSQNARVITSFSMFYDLERPLDFVGEVAQILDDDGVWVFEQSYMPTMLERNSFDTACHEHLEYYAFTQIQFMLLKNGLKAVDVQFNDVNGGSFSVTAAREGSVYPMWAGTDALLKKEQFLTSLQTYRDFAQRTEAVSTALKKFVKMQADSGKRVAALGASTKGNVLLQYCQFTAQDIFAIAEVNSDKFGSFTPGTWIPIRPDSEVIEEADFLIVLPWHFKEFFLNKYAAHRSKLVFPLPVLSVGG